MVSMVSKKAWLALVLVVLVGAGLRFYKTVDFPPSLNWDEVSHAYNAWSLLETGQDQWGMALPVLNFRAYGDYPTTMSLYGTVPAIALFGPSDIAARFPGALLGVLAIVLAFGVGYYWRRNWHQGILLAFLTAVEPWTVFASRQVLQSNWTVFLVFASIMFFLRKRRMWSLIVLFISLFSYHNARIYVPAVCVVLMLAWKDKLSRLVTAAVLLFSIAILVSPVARVRTGTVGIVDSGAVAAIEAQRNASALPQTVKRIIYNRPAYLVKSIFLNYLDYFSPGYLFRHGGTQYQFSLPQHGLLNYLDLPFFYLGLVLLISQSPLLGALFLLAPIPAAITQDRFAVVRSTIMIPFVMLATSIGFTALKRSNLLWIYMGIVLLLLSGYYRNYFGGYPKNYSQSWQYGYKQAISYLLDHRSNYDQVIFSKRYGEAHEYLLWYGKVNPASYLQDLEVGKVSWDYHASWYWVDKIQNVTFVNDWEMPDYVSKLPATKGHLIISSPDNAAAGEWLKNIDFLDGSPAFIITSL